VPFLFLSRLRENSIAGEDFLFQLRGNRLAGERIV